MLQGGQGQVAVVHGAPVRVVQRAAGLHRGDDRAERVAVAREDRLPHRAGGRGPVDSLEPLHPDLVTEDSTKSGVRRFKYRNPRKDFEEETLLPDEVLVLRGRMGRSAIEFARSTLATLFPTRTIVQLNIDPIAAGGGGIHCATQQQPRLKGN